MSHKKIFTREDYFKILDAQLPSASPLSKMAAFGQKLASITTKKLPSLRK